MFQRQIGFGSPITGVYVTNRNAHAQVSNGGVHILAGRNVTLVAGRLSPKLLLTFTDLTVKPGGILMIDGFDVVILAS